MPRVWVRRRLSDSRSSPAIASSWNIWWAWSSWSRGCRYSKGKRQKTEDRRQKASRLLLTSYFLLLYSDGPQLDPRNRRLTVHRRFFNRLNRRHPIDDPAERGVLTIERRGRSGANKK